MGRCSCCFLAQGDAAQPRQTMSSKDARSVQRDEPVSLDAIAATVDDAQRSSHSCRDDVTKDIPTATTPATTAADSGSNCDIALPKPRSAAAGSLETTEENSPDIDPLASMASPASKNVEGEIVMCENTKLLRGPSVSSEEVLTVVDQIWESNIFVAQDYLYDVLCDRHDEDFVSSIRASPQYSSVLNMLRTYERASDMFHKMEGFREAGGVDIDYDAIGVPNDIGCDPHIPIYWKKNGGILCVRLFCEFPLYHRSGKQFSVGYASMFDELDLWHKWHPIIAGDGPALRVPGIQEDRTDFGQSSLRMFELNAVVLKFLRLSELDWNYRYFPPNSGLIVDVLRSVTDNGQENVELHKNFPSAKGFIRKTDRMDVHSVCLVQKDTAVVGFDVVAQIPRIAPLFLVSWVLKTLIPGVVSNMFASGAKSLEPESAYYSRLKDDRKGLYKAVLDAQQAGAALEEARGYRYSAKNLPTPDEFLAALHRKNLLHLEATQLTDEFGIHKPTYKQYE